MHEYKINNIEFDLTLKSIKQQVYTKKHILM